MRKKVAVDINDKFISILTCAIRCIFIFLIFAVTFWQIDHNCQVSERNKDYIQGVNVPTVHLFSQLLKSHKD